MNNLQVIERQGQFVVDSREVAEMVEKNHADLLRSIKTYSLVLSESNFALSDFFLETTYQDSTGRNLLRYDLTKKGCDMVANKMTGEKGVLFTATYVTKFEEMEKQTALNITELSPNLQLINQMFQAMATNEIEAKRMRNEITEVKQTIYLVKDAMAEIKQHWRDWVSENINKIVRARGGSKSLHEEMRSKSYELLEIKAACDLSTRVRNIRKRLSEEGATKTSINNVRKLDAIEADIKLKQIYTSIIRELIIKYAA